MEAKPPTGGEADTVLLGLSEKSVTREIATIYGVYNEQYTLYVVYYEVENTFPTASLYAVVHFTIILIVYVLYPTI
jgi:hypothetical protein